MSLQLLLKILIETFKCWINDYSLFRIDIHSSISDYDECGISKSFLSLCILLIFFEGTLKIGLIVLGFRKFLFRICYLLNKYFLLIGYKLLWRLHCSCLVILMNDSEFGIIQIYYSLFLALTTNKYAKITKEKKEGRGQKILLLLEFKLRIADVLISSSHACAEIFIPNCNSE